MSPTDMLMDYMKELKGKKVHDYSEATKMLKSTRRSVTVPGAIIVGAGPSGLATAACLKERGVPSLILERADCIASLWQLKTYDRLRLHLPKNFCELPLMPFPSDYPTYPNRLQFITYLEEYAKKFDLEPVFNETVMSAEFDEKFGFWRVKSTSNCMKMEENEYFCQWLVVATGENADEIIPSFQGMDEFGGPIFHTSAYKNGYLFRDKNVLVVGCGNSGMEVCLDLCNYNAHPSLVIRDSIHVLPHEMLGKSTFGISMWLLKWFPVRIVDFILLLMANFILGDTAQLGINRPQLGPLELKMKTGKTPVLDVGTLGKVRDGKIKVVGGIKRLAYHAVEFVDGTIKKFDAIVLATGYRSNVPTWLKGTNFFSEDGFPVEPFPNGWKGQYGLYAAGFSKRGLLGAAIDARKVADDINHQWKTSNHLKSNAPLQP